MRSIFLLLFSLLSLLSFAQGPISGFMNGRGVTDIAVTYTSESFEEYRFGNITSARERNQKAYSLFIEHGFSDSFSMVFTAPYIQVDDLNKGLQDGSLHIKYRNRFRENKSGSSTMITATGIRAPLSSYPIGNDNAIGIRAAVFESRLAWQYQWYSGAFLHLQSGFDFRFAPEARSSLPIVIRAGFGGRYFYVDGWLERYHTFKTGTDTQVGGLSGARWWRVGTTVYVPIIPKLGAFVGVSRILGGQNIGLASGLNLGIAAKL